MIYFNLYLNPNNMNLVLDFRKKIKKIIILFMVALSNTFIYLKNIIKIKI